MGTFLDHLLGNRAFLGPLIVALVAFVLFMAGVTLLAWRKFFGVFVLVSSVAVSGVAVEMQIHQHLGTPYIMMGTATASLGGAIVSAVRRLDWLTKLERIVAFATAAAFFVMIAIDQARSYRELQWLLRAGTPVWWIVASLVVQILTLMTVRSIKDHWSKRCASQSATKPTDQEASVQDSNTQ